MSEEVPGVLSSPLFSLLLLRGREKLGEFVETYSKVGITEQRGTDMVFTSPIHLSYAPPNLPVYE
jgi:hypothetical protein